MNDANLLSKPSDCDRLLRVMAGWWSGATWAQIAEREGISRQRVGRLLARVGCTRRRRHKADPNRPDARRGALARHVAEARAALLHPQAHRLTVRQRAALAWLAQGLQQTDIAKRMVTTPQNVRNLLVAARWRLDRLSQPKRRKRTGLRVQRDAPGMAPPGGAAGIALDWARLLDGTDDGRSHVNSRTAGASAGRARADQTRHVGAGRERGVRVRRAGGRGSVRTPGASVSPTGERAATTK
jgi:DNA-binding CsgD family transcriptional regulator